MILVAIAFAVCSMSCQAYERRPIPGATAQNRADALVQEVFGDDIKGATTADKANALVSRLLKEAAKAADPADRFAIYKAAISVAPDAYVAMSIIDESAARFQIDGLKAKAASVVRFANAAKTPTQHKAVAEVCVGLIESFLATNNFAATAKLGGVATSAATRGRDASLVRSVRELNERIEVLKSRFQVVQASMAELEINPINAEANEVVGRYKCFVKGAWVDGLPMLALSADAQLKPVATKELNRPTVSNEQVSLGNAWYDLAEHANRYEQEQIRGRARYWYRLAITSKPPLSSLNRKLVDKKIEEIERLESERVGTRFVSLRDSVLVMSFEPKTLSRQGQQAIAKDASGRNTNGAVHHAAPVRNGKVGSALAFDGRQSQIVVPTLRNALIDNLKACSICFWLRVGGESNGQPKFIFDVGFYPQHSITFMFTHPPTLSFNLPTAHGGTFTTATLPQPDRWHHVTATFDGSRQRLYIDGMLKSEVAVSGLTLNEKTLSSDVARIGAMTKNDGRRKLRFFSGYLDEFAVFRRSLSAAEILSLYRMGLAGQGFGRP
jgi:hypothetical protein